jgi:hypothetical protein
MTFIDLQRIEDIPETGKLSRLEKSESEGKVKSDE